MDQTNETTNHENPKQLETLEGQSNKVTSQTRSYDCNFCKRGFSNAQALGGHMNLHRKDKAKQHTFSNETIQRRSSSDISKNPLLLSSPIPTSRKRQPLVVEASCSSKLLRGTNKCWSWKKDSSSSTDASSGRDQNHVGKIQQLPLFVDKYLGNKDDYQNPKKQVEDREGIEKGFSSKSHGLASLEVDLELRLGPDPLPSLSSSRETMKFF